MWFSGNVVRASSRSLSLEKCPSVWYAAGIPRFYKAVEMPSEPKLERQAMVCLMQPDAFLLVPGPLDRVASIIISNVCPTAEMSGFYVKPFGNQRGRDVEFTSICCVSMSSQKFF